MLAFWIPADLVFAGNCLTPLDGAVSKHPDWLIIVLVCGGQCFQTVLIFSCAEHSFLF